MSQSRFVLLLLLSLVLLAFGAQFLIDGRIDNIAAATVVAASSLLVVLYLLWTSALQTHPLSTFALLGFCLTTQMGALLAQSAAGSSLTDNLRQPLATFATLAFYQLVAVASHALYRIFYKTPKMTATLKSPPIFRSVLQSLKLYAVPTVGALWFMGFMGLFCLLVSGGDGLVSRIAQGANFVAWAPFLIPMYATQQGPGYCNTRRHYVMLGFYALLIVLYGLAANARGMMLSGVMTVVLFALLQILRSPQPVTSKQVFRVAVLGVVMAALSIPVADLVTAMVVARKDRGKVSTYKMVENTLYFATQPQILREQRLRDRFISLRDGYDEVYFASPLIGRLVETKFHDNALYFGSRLSDRDARRITDTTEELLWATLPQPILKAFDVEIDKTSLNFSMGDYISYLGGAGAAGGLGGFRTGSGIAQGMAIFGPGFWPLMFVLFPVLFLAVDVLAYRARDGVVMVSALGMLGLWKMFQYGISAESLQWLIQAVLRTLPQSILLFIIIFFIARKLDGGLRSLGKSRPDRDGLLASS
jgi:hypothetical protein